MIYFKRLLFCVTELEQRETEQYESLKGRTNQNEGKHTQSEISDPIQ